MPKQRRKSVQVPARRVGIRDSSSSSTPAGRKCVQVPARRVGIRDSFDSTEDNGISTRTSPCSEGWYPRPRPALAGRRRTARYKSLLGGLVSETDPSPGDAGQCAGCTSPCSEGWYPRLASASDTSRLTSAYKSLLGGLVSETPCVLPGRGVGPAVQVPARRVGIRDGSPSRAWCRDGRVQVPARRVGSRDVRAFSWA